MKISHNTRPCNLCSSSVCGASTFIKNSLCSIVTVKTQGGKKPLVKSSSSALSCSTSIINIEFHLQLKCAKKRTDKSHVRQSRVKCCVYLIVSEPGPDCLKRDMRGFHSTLLFPSRDVIPPIQ